MTDPELLQRIERLENQNQGLIFALTLAYEKLLIVFTHLDTTPNEKPLKADQVQLQQQIKALKTLRCKGS